MRPLTWLMVVLILLLQYPLWLGKGNWFKVWDLEGQLADRQAANAALQARNSRLAAEVQDLKTGYDALEERARYELGMIRKDEIFFEALEPNPSSQNTEDRP
jgi:cell division protein FtsB